MLKSFKPAGFSLIEVMVAVAIVSGLGMAIYKLQLVSLATSQQTITKQLMLQYADNLVNQMYAHENFIVATGSNTGLGLMPGYSSTSSNSAYVETNYSTAVTPTTDCSTTSCTDNQLASYLLNTWKTNLTTKSNLPSGNIKAIVCKDSALGVPSMSSPNCDGNGTQLVIKIVWQPHNYDVESSALFSNNNYVMLRVPGR
jgi:type IV pilus modification protein PilV